MAEIFAKLGINGKLLLAQIINLLIVFWAIKYFIWPKFSIVLEKRKEKIKQGIQMAEKSKIIMAEAEKEKTKIRRGADLAAERVIKEAEKKANAIYQEIVLAARLEKEKILEEAESRKELIKRQALSDAQKELGNILFKITKKLIPRLEKEKFVEEEIKDSIEEIAAYGRN